MILNIDMTGKEALVTLLPRPKVDNEGVQRTNKTSGLPMWSTQLVITDESGGEIISVATQGEKPPDLAVGDEVELVGVVAHPWSGNGRSGVSYSAQKIELLA